MKRSSTLPGGHAAAPASSHAPSPGARFGSRAIAPSFAEQIGPADDAFEREADRAADAFARRGLTEVGRAGWAAASSGSAVIQSRSGDHEQEEEKIRLAPNDAHPVVQEPATTVPGADRAPELAASAGSAESQEQAETAVDTAPALLVDDDSEASRRQMRKSEFLQVLRAGVCAAVDEALAGTGRDSRGCPWIDYWFGYYEGRDAAQVERSLRRYASEVRGFTTARDYIAPVTARVRRSAGNWASTGEITGAPEDIPATPMAGGEVLERVGGMFFKARPGGPREATPVSVRRELGGGSPLSGELRVRMESAFGASFGGVRLHNDANAARLTDRLNARAFTVGQDVAFGRGEFRPGTIAGDALIAHELAHVVQQRGAAGPAMLAKSPDSTTPLEVDADRSATAFVKQRWFGMRQTARDVAPRLRTGLTLSRCRSSAPPARAAARDFHAGTSIPDAARQAAIQRELHPAAASAPGAPLAMWDAHSASPGTAAQKAARRADLKTRVTQAMLDELNLTMPGIHARAATSRLPVTQLEGPGNAAKKVVDDRFGDWIAIAASTPSQSSLRHGFAFRASGPGQNLFDANDPAQRAAAGLAIDAHDLAGWMAESFGSAAMTPHSFSPTRGGEEADFLENEIVTPFVAAHMADLELFDLFGFALTDPSTGRIVTPTALAPGLSNAPGPGGAPSPAERKLRWSVWETLVHEYIHTLEHPVFHSAGGARNRIMSEGFCTLFSEEVLLDQIPKAPKNATVRAEIEGGNFPEPPAGTVPPFNAGAYAEYLTHAKGIRTQVGDNAVKAAFFQGHVELLGLSPAGATIAPVAASDRDLVTVPAGITTVAGLAAAAHVPVADILAANAGLSAGGPVSGRVHVPGAREHIVVEAGPHGSETKEQIAKQNGITQAALDAANPAVPWGSLSAGDRILIPKR